MITAPFCFCRVDNYLSPPYSPEFSTDSFFWVPNEPFQVVTPFIMDGDSRTVTFLCRAKAAATSSAEHRAMFVFVLHTSRLYLPLQLLIALAASSIHPLWPPQASSDSRLLKIRNSPPSRPAQKTCFVFLSHEQTTSLALMNRYFLCRWIKTCVIQGAQVALGCFEVICRFHEQSFT